LIIDVVPPVPTITSAATAQGQVGVAFTYQITATLDPTSFGASGLPANLVLDPSTGFISGTPRQRALSL
jgi:rhamnogalacturonan endolyase